MPQQEPADALTVEPQVVLDVSGARRWRLRDGGHRHRLLPPRRRRGGISGEAQLEMRQSPGGHKALQLLSGEPRGRETQRDEQGKGFSGEATCYKGEHGGGG